MLFVIVGSAFLLFTFYRAFRIVRFREFPRRVTMFSYRWEKREHYPGEYSLAVFLNCAMVIMAGLVLTAWIRTGAGT